jgi:hypothetical protein
VIQLGWHPKNTPILYRQTHKFLLKNRKRYIQKGWTRSKPLAKRKRNRKRKEKQLREFKIGKAKSIPKEIPANIPWQIRLPNCNLKGVPHICQLVSTTITFLIITRGNNLNT